MREFEEELNSKRNEFGKSLVFSILGILLFYNVLSLFLEHYFPYYKMVASQKLLFIYFIGIAYVSFLISKTKYNFVPLYRIVTFTLFLLVMYISLNISHKSSIVNFFYLPILLMVLIVSNITIAAVCTVLIIIFCMFCPQIAEFLDIAKPTKSSAEYLEVLKILENVIIVFTAYLSLLILYYYNAFINIQLKHSSETDALPDSAKSLEVSEMISNNENSKNQGAVSENEKFQPIYNQIIDYFEHKKPYQHPTFNKRTLTDVLETNETYISKALNQVGNINFNTLVNKYRINQVTDEFNAKNYKKYTIEHIYTRAGFTQQSTFNRVFKEFTGKTPSEYIDALDNEKSRN